MPDNLEPVILKWVLQNAFKYAGKASAGAIIGKILADDPALKARMKELAPIVNKITAEVNKLTIEKQIEKLKELAPELLEEKPKEGMREELPQLKNAVEGKVITRLAPEPSKYNHIGHALIFCINSLYAQRYKGTCILRIEDTNPEKSTNEFLNSMREDLRWAGIKWDKEIIASNDMKLFYEHCEKLIGKGNAYICSCTAELMKKNRMNKKECNCRKKKSDEQLHEWKSMLEGKHKEGEKTVRLIGDMTSNNGVMRDPVIFRISYAKHFLQGEKYCVWPMYDFENAIEEHLCGTTHVIRTKEFELRAELHNKIRELFEYANPEVVEIGRFTVTGAETQGRIIRQMIEEKKVMGWDDPRLVTLKALKRRGFVPEMFKELALHIVGLGKAGTNLDWSVLESINRKLIDKQANRYFFIKEPVVVKIKGTPSGTAKVRLYPGEETRGFRTFIIDEEFWLSAEDVKSFKAGKLYRAMDACNFKKKGKTYEYASKTIDEYKANKGEHIIHWLPKNEKNITVEVVMPNATKIKGLAEKDVLDLPIGAIIQFERFGFARLDSKNEKERTATFWYTHK